MCPLMNCDTLIGASAISNIYLVDLRAVVDNRCLGRVVLIILMSAS